MRASGDIIYGGNQSSGPQPSPLPPLPIPSITVTTLDPIEDILAPVTDAGYRLLGEQLYTRLCSSCHLPLESSNRRGVDAGKILNDYTRNFPTHKPLEWPDAEEAFMIEAALVVPPI